jgi:hypothetical protein
MLVASGPERSKNCSPGPPNRSSRLTGPGRAGWLPRFRLPQAMLDPHLYDIVPLAWAIAGRAKSPWTHSGACGEPIAE